MRRRGVFLSDQDFHSKMLKQTRKFWKLLIWNKKKLSWANISKMNGYFGKNFGDLSEFLPARLTTKCSQSFRFFEMEKLTLLEAFVLLSGEKCCVLFCIMFYYWDETNHEISTFVCYFFLSVRTKSVWKYLIPI